MTTTTLQTLCLATLAASLAVYAHSPSPSADSQSPSSESAPPTPTAEQHEATTHDAVLDTPRSSVDFMQPVEVPVRDTEQSILKPTPPVLTWLTSLPAAHAQSKRNEKPLLIYVTADYCTVCKKMEQTVYRSEEAITQLSRFVLCKLDAEAEYPGSGKKVQDVLNVKMLPHFVLVNPDGKMVVNRHITPSKLLDALEEFK